MAELCTVCMPTALQRNLRRDLTFLGAILLLVVMMLVVMSYEFIQALFGA